MALTKITAQHLLLIDSNILHARCIWWPRMWGCMCRVKNEFQQ